jgi:hypothetical protein
MQKLAPGQQPPFMHFILPLASLSGNFCAIISQCVRQQKRSVDDARYRLLFRLERVQRIDAYGCVV